MLSAATISLAPEIHAGPYLVHGGLKDACARVAKLGFDGAEILPGSAQMLSPGLLKKSLDEHHLRLAAIDSDAGWLLQRLSLTDLDASVRERATTFIGELIELGASFGAPVIIRKMQGRGGEGSARENAFSWLCESLIRLGNQAETAGVPLLFEPLNRYESSLVNTLAGGMEMLNLLGTRSIKFSADLFHMNIEEASPADALRAAGELVSHIHLADNNRLAPGMGHISFGAMADALNENGYFGFVSTACLPRPTCEAAAYMALSVFRNIFRNPLYHYAI